MSKFFAIVRDIPQPDTDDIQNRYIAICSPKDEYGKYWLPYEKPFGEAAMCRFSSENMAKRTLSRFIFDDVSGPIEDWNKYKVIEFAEKVEITFTEVNNDR